MNDCGDGIRVVHPMFQSEGDGAIPISPLHLEIAQMPLEVAVLLNGQWHSRLPSITNAQTCFAYGAIFANRYYAVALWGPPVAREFNGRGYLELRRMAIASDAPKNTGTRMLRVMRLLIERNRPEITKLVSYQDTEVHRGSIYKGAGWKLGGIKKNVGTGWNTRKRSAMQTTADKVRWEYPLHTSAFSAENPERNQTRNEVAGCTSLITSMDLFAGIASTND